jgi:hypothetical protein
MATRSGKGNTSARKGSRTTAKQIREPDKRRRCSGTDDDNSSKQTKYTNVSSSSPSGLNLETENNGQGEDSVSSLQEGSSVLNNNMEEKWRMIEDRIKSVEDRQGEVSVVSAGATSATSPENEKILKENLRRFVTTKVFPSWKFIFKKELLEKCVVAAVSKSYITVPPGFDQIKLAERYGQTVRACLDGCRANAQTAARKRYLGK